MNTFDDIWRKLAKSKKYREEFALAFLKRSVPFQVKTLRKKHCGSQAVLAERAKLTQGVVSRAEDQDYGNLTLNTIGRIAAGLDMAFIGKFVPFTELVKFSLNLSEEEFAAIPTFEEELNAVPETAATTPIFGNVVGNVVAVATEHLPARAFAMAGHASTDIVDPCGIMLFHVRDFRSLGPPDIGTTHGHSYESALFQTTETAGPKQVPIGLFISDIEAQKENLEHAS